MRGTTNSMGPIQENEADETTLSAWATPHSETRSGSTPLVAGHWTCTRFVLDLYSQYLTFPSLHKGKCGSVLAKEADGNDEMALTPSRPIIRYYCRSRRARRLVDDMHFRIV